MNCADCSRYGSHKITNPAGVELRVCDDDKKRRAEHPGKVFFLGRWRTLEECAERISEDRGYRGVEWTVEGDQAIGRDGGFEVRLNLTKSEAGQ